MKLDVYGDRSFKLDEDFYSKFQNKEPKWGYGDLSRLVYYRTYSRNGENFAQTCRRVIEGMYNIQKAHCNRLHLPWDDQKAQRSAQEAFQRLWEFKWCPPGRGFWMMGVEDVENKGAAALNNCGFVTTLNIDTDFAEPFCWLMDMSMLGVGVGFDTLGAGKVEIKPLELDDREYHIPDSREGWVDSVCLLLLAYVKYFSIPKFDYSLIRPKGAPIKGFGGVASGPEPLKELHESIRGILDARVGSTITSTDIVDIANLIGKCVIAGNVRRTAEIAFGSPHDDKFLALKDPETNGAALMSHRWASNNSVNCFIGTDYRSLGEQTARNGEPGYFWLENARQYSRMMDAPSFRDSKAMGSNPCVEQTLEDHELCCLVETFPAHHNDLEDYWETLKYAYLYAKTVTLVPTHDAKTNAVVMRNRRIGCSMSGIVQAIEKYNTDTFFRDYCDAGYLYIDNYDETYSDWLCIPRSIKMTSVKPSGTVSLLAGATPGIHYPHSEYYIRRVRLAKDSPYVKQLEEQGYHVEPCQYSKESMVVSFPIRESNFQRKKEDVSMWEQLELAAQMQYWWADNQVSATITFKPEEAKDIPYALNMYQYRLKGVSFLPLDGGGYVQAPYEEITKEQYQKILINSLVNYVAVHEETDRFCDGDTCEI